MNLNQLLESIRNPPPESMVGLMTRADGKAMRFMPFMILFNLAWLFLWIILARQPFATVILPTILTVPVFVYFHLGTYFYGGPPTKRRHPPRSTRETRKSRSEIPRGVVRTKTPTAQSPTRPAPPKTKP